MKKITLLIIFATTLLQGQTIPENLNSPIYSGLYLPGMGGVRDFVFSNEDGLAFIDYNIIINSDTFYNRHGNKANNLELGDLVDVPITVPVDVDISGYINSLAISYISPPLDFLGGGEYICMIVPSYSTASLRVGLGELTNGETIKGGVSGFGDLAVSPLTIAWRFDPIDFTFAYTFTAPTGRYETGENDNIGAGYWGHLFQIPLYYYPTEDKSTAFMLMPSYEFYGKLKDTTIRPGSHFFVEYGISQYFSERFAVSVQGGHGWQTGKDSGSDVYWNKNIKDQMSTIGIGAGYWVIPDGLYAHVKYTDTYANKQHFDLQQWEIELVIPTNWLKSKKKTVVEEN